MPTSHTPHNYWPFNQYMLYLVLYFSLHVELYHILSKIASFSFDFLKIFKRAGSGAKKDGAKPAPPFLDEWERGNGALSL